VLKRPRNGWLFAVALAAAGALLIVLVVRASAIAASITNNSDLAAPLVIARLAHTYRHAQVATGRLGWWGPLWLLQLVRSLPISGLVGSYVPIIITVVLPLLVAGQAWRLWGPAAALAVVLVALSVGGATWAAGLGGWSARSPTWWMGGAVALWSVWVAGIDGVRAAALAALTGVVIALLVGIVGSGDQLMVAGAEIPLGVTALYLLSRRRWPQAVGMILMAVLALLATSVVAHIARDHGYLRQGFPIVYLPFEQLGTSFSNTLLALESTWQGPLPTHGGGYDLITQLGALTGYLGAFLVLVAVAGVGVAVLRWASTVIPAGRRRLLPPLASGRELQRGTWVAVWGAMLIGYLAAFGGTAAQGPLGSPISRYLFGVPLAAGALMPPIVACWRRRLTVVLALGLAALGVLGLIARSPWSPNLQTDVSRSLLFGRLKAVAAQEHITRGFAGYWIAYPLTLDSGYKLDVSPVGDCLRPAGEVCTMYLNYVDQTYAYRPHTRSFLLVDASPAAHIPFPPAVVLSPPTNVKPEQVISIGDGMTMEIFASDFTRYMRGDADLGDPRLFRGGPLPPS
jgi:hypothetical protein